MIELPPTASAALAALADARRERIARECAELVLVGQYADCCPPVLTRPAAAGGHPGRTYGSAGTPEVDEFAADELGAVLATTTTAAATVIGDVLDLRHRLPQLWAVVQAGVVPAWKARKVAKATRDLGAEAAGRVDTRLAGLIITLPWARFETILDAAVLAADPVGAEQRAAAWAAERFVRTGTTSGHGYKLLIARATAGEIIWFEAMVARIAQILAADGDTDPVQVRRSKAIGILAQPAVALDLLQRHHTDQDETTDDGESTHVSVRTATSTRIDPATAAPRVVLHVHLTGTALHSGTGVARMEGVGPVTVGQIQRFLGTRSCRISVQPVLDPDTVTPVDAYEIPHRMAENLRHRHPVEIFPYGTAPARTPHGTTDLDHTIPYLHPDRGGPPGQTGTHNLGPLSRHHHRTKTHAGWTVRQPEPGTYVWRSPHGHLYTVDATGTHPHGHGTYAHALWHAVLATPPLRRMVTAAA